MFITGLEHTIPDSRGQCANHCAMKYLKLELVFVIFIDSQYEHRQKCVNAIGTPCLSPNIVDTQGVPIGVKGSTVQTS